MADDDLAAKLKYWREHPGSFSGRLRRAGTTNVRPVPRDDNGKLAGYQTEHWSDRVDAHVMPEPIEVRVKLSGGNDAA